jgi:hypothetical protein
MVVKKARKPAETSRAVIDVPKPKAEMPKIQVQPKETNSAYITVDHPTQGEIISGLHYAIRIGASGEGAVEISFNDADWNACRPAAGYWWFDWGYFTPGMYKISARLIDSSGKVIKKSSVNKVKVV